jgi:hypothetical protein
VTSGYGDDLFPASEADGTRCVDVEDAASLPCLEPIFGDYDFLAMVLLVL